MALGPGVGALESLESLEPLRIMNHGVMDLKFNVPTHVEHQLHCQQSSGIKSWAGSLGGLSGLLCCRSHAGHDGRASQRSQSKSQLFEDIRIPVPVA